MNRYTMRRFLGLRELHSTDYYRRSSEFRFMEAKEQFEENQSDPRSRERMLRCAWQSSRIHELELNLSDDIWSESGCLDRGRLRFYRAIAEKPDFPDASILEAAAADFRMAADYPESAAEALAALIRLHGLLGNLRSTMKHLARLLRSRSGGYRQAAAGAMMFLADLDGTSAKQRRNLLKRASRLFAAIGSESAALLQSDILGMIGHSLEQRKILMKWTECGSADAQIALIRMDVQALSQNDNNTGGRVSLLRRLEAYAAVHPSDPRANLLEGDVHVLNDPESARIAWRSGLVLDDHHAETWSRLASLYHEGMHKSEKEFQETWLQAALEAARKAVLLEPLDPVNRFILGSIERDSGLAGPATASINAGLSISPWDMDARRLLGLAWLDLAYCDHDSVTAANYSSKEWEKVIDGGSSTSYDLISLIKSLLFQKKTHDEIPVLLQRLLKSQDDIDNDDLLNLAGDFVNRSLYGSAQLLIEAAEKRGLICAEIYALKGRMDELSDPRKALNSYLYALEIAPPSSRDYIEWTISAARIAENFHLRDAESILRRALKTIPESRKLLYSLIGLLQRQGKLNEALSCYEQKKLEFAVDTLLLEEAKLFCQEIGQPEKAEEWIRFAIQQDSENSQLWNQLGVYYMETSLNYNQESQIARLLELAVNAYTKAVELSPEEPVFLANLGDAYRQTGKWEQAEKILNEAGEEPYAENSLARLQDERSYLFEGDDLAQKDWESAGNHYRKSAEKDKKNSDFQRDYAWWLYRSGQLTEALNLYRNTQKLSPSDADLLYGEFLCLRDLCREDEALKVLDSALNIQAEDMGMLADKADILGETGRWQEGSDIYSGLTKSSKTPQWIWIRYAEYIENRLSRHRLTIIQPRLSIDASPYIPPKYLLNQELTSFGYHLLEDVDEVWEHAACAKPGDIEIFGRWGAIKMRLGKVSEARRLLRKSLKHLCSTNKSAQITQDSFNLNSITRSASETESDAFKLHCLGCMALYQSDRKTAIKYLKSALRLVPRSSEIWADLGLAFALEEEWEEALIAYRHADELADIRFLHRANRGIAAYRAGHWAESVEMLQSTLQYYGSDGEWENALGLAYLAAGNSFQALNAFRKACLSQPKNSLYPANYMLAYQSLHIPRAVIQ